MVIVFIGHSGYTPHNCAGTYRRGTADKPSKFEHYIVAIRVLDSGIAVAQAFGQILHPVICTCVLADDCSSGAASRLTPQPNYRPL
jgi:hypothetical protein